MGRVISPTLAMAVLREAEISAFQPESFYTVHLALPGMTVTSARCKEKTEAEVIAVACFESTAVVTKCERRERRENAPALYDLTFLQRDANRLLGYTAQQTLDYAQSLYEKKLITYGKKKNEFLTPSTVKNVHKLLRSCFEQAVKWELMEKNPCIYATLPKVTSAKGEIWTAETLFHAMEVCEDERLKLCMNLAFACSLRMGELLGLTWDCVDISPESRSEGTANIYINKELQRVNRDVLNALEKKDVVMVFPPISSRTTTVQVLKAPKTQTSIRKIFLPKTVAEMLVKWKGKQDAAREMLGEEYHDFNLVVAGPLGMPTESGTITSAFRKLIAKNDLPPVVFHSLRHSSITYKLKLNGGDIKAVQGDSGHAQAKMVTDQYSHIIDDDRRHNAELFENAFYEKKGAEEEIREKPKTPPVESPTGNEEEGGLDVETLAKLASSPELASLLKILAKKHLKYIARADRERRSPGYFASGK
ncbi:MAG: DNA topoisomerase [Lachnospiraceae bacterium]|nr:DNA topoisomerase [Lachnospiraceae bacterium]